MEFIKSGRLCVRTRLDQMFIFLFSQFFLESFVIHAKMFILLDSVEEMKSFLSMQQKAMSCLIETVSKDKETTKTIQDKLSELVN